MYSIRGVNSTYSLPSKCIELDISESGKYISFLNGACSISLNETNELILDFPYGGQGFCHTFSSMGFGYDSSSYQNKMKITKMGITYGY